MTNQRGEVIDFNQSEAYPGCDEPSEGELVHSGLLNGEGSFAGIHPFNIFTHIFHENKTIFAFIPFVLTEQSEYSILSSAK